PARPRGPHGETAVSASQRQRLVRTCQRPFRRLPTAIILRRGRAGFASTLVLVSIVHPLRHRGRTGGGRARRVPEAQPQRNRGFGDSGRSDGVQPCTRGSGARTVLCTSWGRRGTATALLRGRSRPGSPA